TGCEVCHGPGSDHAAWASNPANQGQASRFIVQPERLSPSREMLICGRCHDRVQGNGSIINDEPLDSQNRFPPVGIKRSDYLASYVSRNGPGTGDFWSDAVHSKSHHQQYSDLLKSTMHRNGRIITTCSDCHDSHGDGPFRHHLVENPDDANGALCASCHRDDLFEHIAVQTGFTHAGNQTTCTKCHMSETAKTGAGRYGILLGAPTGQAGDVNVTYFENDITSHLFGAIPRKQHPDVAGVQPGSAMPIPYTNSCGAVCHQAAIIPFLAPVGAPLVVAPGESVPAGEPDDGAAMVPLARPEDQR
ncbi:MAG: hypothetical protein KDB53_18665, partial [Planctomycetes bacterium]|nr:hypothetical protein [Planctomycetota bacterium]